MNELLEMSYADICERDKIMANAGYKQGFRYGIKEAVKLLNQFGELENENGQIEKALFVRAIAEAISKLTA